MKKNLGQIDTVVAHMTLLDGAKVVILAALRAYFGEAIKFVIYDKSNAPKIDKLEGQRRILLIPPQGCSEREIQKLLASTIGAGHVIEGILAPFNGKLWQHELSKHGVKVEDLSCCPGEITSQEFMGLFKSGSDKEFDEINFPQEVLTDLLKGLNESPRRDRALQILSNSDFEMVIITALLANSEDCCLRAEVMADHFATHDDDDGLIKKFNQAANS